MILLKWPLLSPHPGNDSPENTEELLDRFDKVLEETGKSDQSCSRNRATSPHTCMQV